VKNRRVLGELVLGWVAAVWKRQVFA